MVIICYHETAGTLTIGIKLIHWQSCTLTSSKSSYEKHKKINGDC